MPHLLIAGTTGSGKSVCISAMTLSLVMNNRPEDLKLVMIDPKMVELTRFAGLPHIIGKPESDMERLPAVLKWVVDEMERRYKEFAKIGSRNVQEYNESMKRREEEPLPRIVVLIDELADMMMQSPIETEKQICRSGADGARNRHPHGGGHAAPERRCGDRSDQGQLPVAHRVLGRLVGGLARDSGSGRRGVAARSRRHAVYQPGQRHSATRAGLLG